MRELKIEVENVTPERAKELLERNTGNFRRMDPNRVRRYAKEMASGNWKLNGETVSFNGSGTLLNGQHRLKAVVKAGVAVPLVLVFNAEGIETLDRGKTRTLSQVLTASGIKNSAVKTGAARWVLGYRAGVWANRAVHIDQVVDSEIIAELMDNDEAYSDIVAVVMRCKRLIPQSILAAILYVGSDGAKRMKTANWFANAIADGVDLDNLDAVLHLRNRILKQSPSSRLDPSTLRWLATKAWNLTVTESPCTPNSLRIIATGPNKTNPPEVIEVASE